MTYDYSRIARDPYDKKFVPNPRWPEEENIFGFERQIERIDVQIEKVTKMRDIVDKAWKEANKISDNYPGITGHMDRAFVNADAGLKRLKADREDMIRELKDLKRAK